MRSSRVIVSVLAAASLALTACSSGTTAAPRTSTVVVTASETAATTPPAASGGVTVPALPSGSVEASGSAVPGSTAVETVPASETATVTGSETAPTTETTEETTEGAPFKKVDPLKADCAKLLSAGKIKTELGKAIGATNKRIVDVANPERKITGRLKCQYGVKGDSASVTVNLTQYTNAAAADAQIATTVSSEDGFGAIMSKGTVNGYPAEIALRDGGLIVVRYSTWTISVVIGDKLLTAPKLPDALTGLAEAALTAIVK